MRPSKKRKLRPSFCFSLTRQFVTSGCTSRSNAATIAIRGLETFSCDASGIAVGSKPLYRTLQGIIYGNDPPAQFSLRLGGGGKHFLLAHADGIDGGAWL